MDTKREQSQGQKDQAQTQAAQGSPAVQGEGDYEAARRYREEVDDFVSHNDVTAAARRAQPKSAAEARDLALAEEAGKSRSKGDDAVDAARMYPGKKPSDADV